MNAQETLDIVFADESPLHEDATGAAVNWSISKEALAYLARDDGDLLVTAETGCGRSTLWFGAVSAQHHTFTLAVREPEAIRSAADRLDLDVASVRFHIGDSADTLPDAELRDLDAVLIDGAHSFPYPAIDWHYLGRQVRVGGLLGVDDVWMPSVQQLTAFLDAEPSWRSVWGDGQTVWYRRVEAADHASYFTDSWDRQGLNEEAGQRVAKMREYSRLPTREKILHHPLLTSEVLARRLVRQGRRSFDRRRARPR